MAYRSEVTGCFESEQELDPRVPRGLNRHLQGLWAEALRHKDIRLLGTLEEGRTVSGETDRSMLPRLKGSDDFGTIASWVRNLVQANSVRTIGVSDFASDRDSISYGAQFGMVMVSRNFDLRDQRGRRLSLDTERVIFTLVGTEMRRQTLLHLKEAMIQSGKDSIFDVHTGRQIGWDELEVMIAEMEMVVGNDVVDLVSVMRGGKSEPNSKAARARRNKDVVPFFQPRAVAVQTIDQSVTRGFRFPAASRWALVGLSFSAAAALAACNSRGATIAPVTATPQQLEMTKTPAPVKTPEPTKTAVPTATEAPKFVEYGSLLFGSVSAAEPKNMALAELADKKLKSSIESAAEKQLGLKVAEMGLWSARYDNGVGMVVVFKDNGDGTASQWMAFSQGSNGELLPVGSTDQIVFLQLYQIDRDNGDGTKLIRIGFDEKVTADKDMILPPFIMFTVGADGKIAGEVDMLYPFGQKETKSIKVLASLIERFVPKSDVAIAVEKLGLPEAVYKIEPFQVGSFSVDLLKDAAGSVVAQKAIDGDWVRVEKFLDILEENNWVFDPTAEKRGIFNIDVVSSGIVMDVPIEIVDGYIAQVSLLVYANEGGVLVPKIMPAFVSTKDKKFVGIASYNVINREFEADLYSDANNFILNISKMGEGAIIQLNILRSQSLGPADNDAEVLWAEMCNLYYGPNIIEFVNRMKSGLGYPDILVYYGLNGVMVK